VTGRALGAAVLTACLLLAPAGAAGKPQEVNIEFSAYGPSQLDILPGETVVWTNVSLRTHTVTSDTGLFDSDKVDRGGHFSHTFTQVGTYRYHCTIHPGITGEIDVRRVTLGPLPTAAVAAGARIEFNGRTATPARPVTVQRSVNGAAFTPIARAAPAPDGSWKTTVSAQATGDYRASAAGGTSRARRMLVGIRHVRIRATRTGISFTVTPSAPYAPVLVEAYLRERFGWWPVATARTDYVSEGTVRVHGPARVRVVLVDTDGWTPIATSPVVALGRK
jgi:plastocyanin